MPYESYSELALLDRIFYMKLKYTKEYCKSIADTCKSRKEFKNKNINAYHKALAEHWLDEFGLTIDRHIKWTKEACINAASECYRWSEFHDKYPGAYYSVIKNNWRNELVFPVPIKCKKRTNEEITNVAKQYTSYSEFYRKERSFYYLAHKHKILQTFTWLQRKEDRPENGITDNVYVYEFTHTKVAYVGRTINPNRRHYEHVHNNQSAVYKYALKNHVDIPEPKYIYTNIAIKEGKLQEANTIKYYQDNGWVLLNKAPAGSIGSLSVYSKSQCITIAKRYKFKKDLFLDKPTIYNALVRHHWIKECTWLKSYKRKWDDITYDQFVDIAKKYTCRSVFRQHNSALYYVVAEKGWVDKYFPPKIKPRPVVQYTMDGKYVAEYKSVSDAAKALNCVTDSIINCCKHRTRYIKHFKVEYKSVPTES